jgi:hypothetical protein
MSERIFTYEKEMKRACDGLGEQSTASIEHACRELRHIQEDRRQDTAEKHLPHVTFNLER